MTSESFLPKPVRDFLNAASARDIDAIFSTFSPTAYIVDEARPYVGPEAIREWLQRSFVQLKTSLSVQKVSEDERVIGLNCSVTGDYEAAYGITDPINLDWYFTLSNDKIIKLYITNVPKDTKTMPAVYATKQDFDNPISGLRFGQRPIPETREGWVLLTVTAASVNWHDIWTLRGFGMYPIKYPIILGTDAVGFLDDGSEMIVYPVMGSEDWRGDETLDPNRNIFSELSSGSLAGYVNVPRRNLVPLPKGMSVISAAALGTAWLTAYRMIFTKSGVRPGQTMLVQGSSGGIATALIQLGAAAGITVWATGRTEKKRALAIDLGASRVFAPGETVPNRVDAVFDLVGEATLKHSLDSVKTGGTVVTCGGHGGVMATVDLSRIFIEQITLKGSYMGTLEEFKGLIQFVANKKIEPKVGKILTWQQAEEGFRSILDGSTDGKVIIMF